MLKVWILEYVAKTIILKSHLICRKLEPFVYNVKINVQ